MDQDRANEHTASGVRQIRYSSRTCQAIQRLQFPSQCQAYKLRQGSGDNTSAGRSHPCPEGNRIGTGVSFAVFCALPRGHERHGASWRTRKCNNLCSDCKIHRDRTSGTSYRRVYCISAYNDCHVGNAVDQLPPS